MPHPSIILEKLNKVYGDVTAVHDLSMTVEEGEIFGFLGANGAGKTTTIRMLCGLLKATSGKGEIQGKDIWTDRYAIRQKFGYVAQKFSLYPDLTVEENLRFFSGAYQVSKQKHAARIEHLMQEMDLKKKSGALAGNLSGGMKQLLALGCALVHEPSILFLDEPTAGLDPVHRQQLWDLLYQLSHAGTTIFVTTHYMDEAERCTHVGFLHNGNLIAKDTPQNLKNSFANQLLELEVDPLMPALLKLRKIPEVWGTALRSGKVRIYTAEPQKLLEKWKISWPFPELKLINSCWVKPDMEDIFTSYSQGYNGMISSKESV